MPPYVTGCPQSPARPLRSSEKGRRYRPGALPPARVGCTRRRGGLAPAGRALGSCSARGDTMQAKEWGTCTQPGRMLLFLGGQASGRKLRLFACACVRRVWYLLQDERSWVAVEVTERFADRRALRAELASAGQAAQEVCSGHRRIRPTPGHYDAEAAAVRLASSPTTGRRWAGARYVAEAVVEAVAHGPVWDAACIDDRNATCGALRGSEKRAQCGLLRCLFGNPFRPV